MTKTKIEWTARSCARPRPHGGQGAVSGVAGHGRPDAGGRRESTEPATRSDCPYLWCACCGTFRHSDICDGTLTDRGCSTDGTHREGFLFVPKIGSPEGALICGTCWESGPPTDWGEGSRGRP